MEETEASISVSLGRNVNHKERAICHKPKPDTTKNSEITVKQFLDLLKTAYQVHDNLEDLLLSKGMTDVIDWIKVKGFDIDNMQKIETPNPEPESKSESAIAKTEQSDRSTSIDDLDANLQDKLTTVLSEGIMDSVLPLITTNCDQSSSRKKPVAKTTSADKLSIKKKSSAHLSKSEDYMVKRSASEVEIHVCDELKGMKKDFVCNQKLLVEQMGYFSDVSKVQRLEDMDISVHCDITIFEWLMRWVKRMEFLPGDQPGLDTKSVIPILVSATFLQMEPLINECLHYCHKNMNDILKTTSSMSCLNDVVFTRLSAMYTNSEIETIKDRKDKIQSKLYCKMIQSLCEPENETLRGHYCTMAQMYKCNYCQQLINPKYGECIPCIPQRMRLQFDGSVINSHERDTNWDINSYIMSLYKSLKTWRRVYWRLWGTCHFLYCNTCKMYFPAKQEGWCRYHPDLPQFFTLDTQKPPLPVGRYPCCGERAYRFQVLEDRRGCRFREHSISTTDIRDAAIAGQLESMKGLIIEEAPKLVFPDRLTRLIAREPTDPDDCKLDTKEIFWWDGIEIVPPRPKLGLLPLFEPSDVDSDSSDDLESEDDFDDLSDATPTSISNSDSEESINPIPKRRIAAKRKLKKKGRCNARLWQPNLTSRSNQDMQRLNEEVTFKKIAQLINHQTKLTAEIESAKAASKTAHKAGGVWVRLESEWKERTLPNSNKSKNIYNGKVRLKTGRVI